MAHTCKRIAFCSRKIRAFLAFAVPLSDACVSNGSSPPAPSRGVESTSRNLQGGAPAHSSLVNAPEAVPAPTGDSPGAQRTRAAAAISDLNNELSALPDNVLVGTDVVSLSDLLSTASRIPTTGTFRSEQGGAEAQVRLATAARGLSLRREFSEPGTEPQIKLYENLQASPNGARLSGKDIELLGIGKNILVLEKHSGVEGIPGAMWIQYESVK